MMVALIGLSVLLQQNLTSLKDGSDVYVLAPPIYVAQYGVGVKWASDSKSLVYQTFDTLRGRPSIIAGVERDGRYDGATTDLVRWNVATGTRTVLASLKDSEYLGQFEIVGPGGDVVFLVRKVEGASIVAQIWYAPERGQSTRLTDWFQSTSSSTLCSRKSRTALIANSSEKTMEVFAISDGAFRKVEGLGEWDYASFTGLTTSGDAVIALSTRGEPAKSDVLKIDLRSLGVSRVGDDQLNFEPLDPPARRFLANQKPLVTGDEPLYALRVLQKADPTHGLLISPATKSGCQVSPDELKCCYQTPDGYFIREQVKVSPAAAKKLSGQNPR
ncbi:MAG: hypothetical protein ACOYON_16270 [Fimbriimonas sp.]